MSNSDQPSMPVIKLKEGEPDIFSLSPIGFKFLCLFFFFFNSKIACNLAFSVAIHVTYINYPRHLNPEEDPCKRLIDAASSIIECQKTEFGGLH